MNEKKLKLKPRLIIVLVLVVSTVCSFIVNGAQTMEIDNCTTLETEDTVYILNTSIVDSLNTTCVKISADNVTLDCAGLTIDGNAAIDHSIGVYVNSTKMTTIKNCTVTEFNAGLFGNLTKNLTILNSNLSYNYYSGASRQGWWETGQGLFIEHSYNLSIHNSTFINGPISSGYPYGAFIGSTQNVFIKNSDFHLADVGIWVYDSTNITIIGSSANNNEDTGFYIDSSEDVNLSYATATDNGYTGVVFGYGSNYGCEYCNISGDYYGLGGFSSTDINVIGSTITDIDGGNINRGIDFSDSADVIVQSTTISGYNGSGASGIHTADNSSIDRVTITNCYYGVFVNKDNTSIYDSIITDNYQNIVYNTDDTTHYVEDTNISTFKPGGQPLLVNTRTNITLVNVTYSKDDVTNPNQEGFWIYRYWWGTTYVNELTGTPIPSVNVTIYNSSNSIVVSGLTDSAGKYSTKLLEYTKTRTGGVFIETEITQPYNITVSKNLFITQSKTFNISTLKNVNYTVSLNGGINVTLLYPEAESYASSNISLNFSLVNDTTLDLCWYYILNSSGGYEVSDTTIGCFSNTTININDGTFNLYLYANGTNGYTVFDNTTFYVSTVFPAVTLISPTDLQWLAGPKNYGFNFTATDDDNTEDCAIYTNATGDWASAVNISGVVSGANTQILANLSDGTHKWNIWCNDTLGNSGFSPLNRTVRVDATYPSVSILTENKSSVSGTVFSFRYNITDTNIEECYFTLRNETGGLHNYEENTSLSCGIDSRTISTLTYGTYSIQTWGADYAGNTNTSTISFVLTTPPQTGGGSTEPSVIIETQNRSAIIDFSVDVIDFLVLNAPDLAIVKEPNVVEKALIIKNRGSGKLEEATVGVTGQISDYIMAKVCSINYDSCKTEGIEIAPGQSAALVLNATLDSSIGYGREGVLQITSKQGDVFELPLTISRIPAYGAVKWIADTTGLSEAVSFYLFVTLFIAGFVILIVSFGK